MLLIFSGIMWNFIGILLNSFAYGWMLQFTKMQKIYAVSTGLTLGALIAYYGFSRIALKNIARIKTLPGSACLFAFQEWKSYGIIIIMMSMGIFLRTSQIVPKTLLAPMYIGIGTALFVSGILYHLAASNFQDSPKH